MNKWIWWIIRGPITLTFVVSKLWRNVRPVQTWLHWIDLFMYSIHPPAFLFSLYVYAHYSPAAKLYFISELSKKHAYMFLHYFTLSTHTILLFSAHNIIYERTKNSHACNHWESWRFFAPRI